MAVDCLAVLPLSAAFFDTTGTAVTTTGET
jgi:hypothetical protein